jgi:hypothetical protein
MSALSFWLGIGVVIAMFWALGAYFHSIRDDGRPGWMQVGDWGGGRIRARRFARATFICDHIPFGLGEEIHGFIETRNRPALRNGVVLMLYSGQPDSDDEYRVEWADHAFVPANRFEVRGEIVRIPVIMSLPKEGAPTNRGSTWTLRASAGSLVTGFRAAFDVPVAETNVFRLRYREAPSIPSREFVPAQKKPYKTIAACVIAAAVLITSAILTDSSPAFIRWFFIAIGIGFLYQAISMVFETIRCGVRDGLVIIERHTVLGNSARTVPVSSVRKVDVDSFDSFGTPYWNVRLTLDDGKDIAVARYQAQRRIADELATSIREAIQSRASSLTT